MDRWEHNRKQPLRTAVSDACDSCQLLDDWFAGAERLVIVADETALDWRPERTGPTAGLLSGRVYLSRGDGGLAPLVVLIGQGGIDLPGLARRYAGDAKTGRPPLLVHPYWPRRPALDFTAHGLPRPLPLLPRLIRAGQYRHQPGGPVPSEAALLLALARALGHPFTVLGQVRDSP